MKLYGYFRSGTSHRLRIALNLKGLEYEYIPINLFKEQHLQPDFKAINHQGLVPVLEVDGLRLFQSPAIIEWLEETYTDTPLLPEDSFGRMRVRALSALVGCDIHPINNRRILQYLRKELSVNEEEVQAWCHRWINDGFTALEKHLVEDKERGDFCYGNKPTFADCYLVPQVYSARRFNVDLTLYPNIVAVDKHCRSLEAFIKAEPENQSDAF